MKTARWILALALLTIAATPMYALCQNCLTSGNCALGVENLRCRPTINGCYSGWPCSVTASRTPLAVDYRIASVEITHGTANTPAKPAAARIAQNRK